MSIEPETFLSSTPLTEGRAARRCCACVVVPARNEEYGLPSCLEALHRQVGLAGEPLPHECYEVLVLLNNCTDRSAERAREWCARENAGNVYILERRFAEPHAHVGTARALLMDTAWHRLQQHASTDGAILSTDADSVVASDWLAQNLRALAAGADVVGGAVELRSDELKTLSPAVRRCYEQDRRYAALIAQLEDVLDAQPGDPSPRHLDHFGSSLACTHAAYAAAGGMPAVSPLEDEAFVDQVRRAGLRLRHEPRVRVFTSARMEGRAPTGMAGQFRVWAGLRREEDHVVASAAFLEHRFRMLRRLREVFATRDISDLTLPTEWWRAAFANALKTEMTCAGFLAAVNADVFIKESFEGETREPIGLAIAGLAERVSA